MNANSVLGCVLLCAYFGGVFSEIVQVGGLCAPQDRYLMCGCPKSCRDPAPDCKGVCREGCFCPEGLVRNDEGTCVELHQCPQSAIHPHKLEGSEPRLNYGICPPNEEFRSCEPCNHTCDNPNPICPAQCGTGCYCRKDLLRDKDGRCVKFEQCSNFIEYIREKEKNVFAPIPYRYSCGANQQYKECQKCSQTCADKEPVCGRCKTGCFCKDGLVKGPGGTCIAKEECPKGSAYSIHFYSSIEDCSSGEEFYRCGSCEASCQAPAPDCPAGCVSGCQCRPPSVRHANGLCVPRSKCPAKCSDPNEEYSCLFGCERRCQSAPARACYIKRYPLRCALGCHCKRGLYRNTWNMCVEQEQCDETGLVVD